MQEKLSDIKNNRILEKSELLIKIHNICYDIKSDKQVGKEVRELIDGFNLYITLKD